MHITAHRGQRRAIHRAFGVGIMLAAGLAGYTSVAPAQDTAKAIEPTPAAKRATKSKPQVEEPVWPVKSPDPLPGAIIPSKRIVAVYRNPLSKRMGILGELSPD